jgi:SAM-dependent methyltransferase
MLNNRLGVFLYLLLQNRWSWNLLSTEEKGIIHKANYDHNNFRPDYKNPEKYETGLIDEGVNWDTFDFHLRGKEDEIVILRDYLTAHNPRSVLEVGPGSGFYSRQICEFSSVKEYVACDINNGFLQYLAPRLDQVKRMKSSFHYTLHNGDFKEIDLPRVDSIVLMNTVHHIPDRLLLFDMLRKALTVGGSIICVDPAHYFSRIVTLLRKYFRFMHKPDYWLNRNNLSTHHFCTLSEFKNIGSQVNLRISREWFCGFSWPFRLHRIFHPLLEKCLRKSDVKSLAFPVVQDQDSFLRYFSRRIGIIFNKD